MASMSLLESMRFYEYLLKLLGVNVGTTKIKLLNWILDQSFFCVADVTAAIPEMHRTEVYKTMKVFLECDLIVEIPRVDIGTLPQELQDDIAERGVASRINTLQRLGVNRKKYWLFTPQRAVRRIEERIENLKELAGLLRGLP